MLQRYKISIVLILLTAITSAVVTYMAYYNQNKVFTGEVLQKSTASFSPKDYETSFSFIYHGKKYFYKDLDPMAKRLFGETQDRWNKKQLKIITKFLIEKEILDPITKAGASLDLQNVPLKTFPPRSDEEIRCDFVRSQVREKLIRQQNKKYSEENFYKFKQKYERNKFIAPILDNYQQKIKALFESDEFIFNYYNFFAGNVPINKEHLGLASEGEKNAPVKIVFFFNYADPHGQFLYRILKDLLPHLEDHVEVIYYPMMIDGEEPLQVLWSHMDRCMRSLYPQYYSSFVQWGFHQAMTLNRDPLFHYTHPRWDENYLHKVQLTYPVAMPKFKKCIYDRSVYPDFFVNLWQKPYTLGVNISSAIFMNGLHIKNIKKDLINRVEEYYRGNKL